jgi:hypothetical protein
MDDRAFRAKLWKLVQDKGDLYHFYADRIAGRVDRPLAGVLADLAIESAKLDGDFAALLIEHADIDGTEAEERAAATSAEVTPVLMTITEPDPAPIERRILSMCTVASGTVASGTVASGPTATARRG